MSKHLVEECWILSTSQLKKDLKKIRNSDETIEGQITLRNDGKQMNAVYWNASKDRESYLVIALPNTEPKEILLRDATLNFGTTTFFACPNCLKNCSKLYVHPEVRKSWRCAKCNGLVYHLQSFNLYSKLGVVEYKMDQMDKLFSRRKPRMIYAGKPTKPLLRRMHKMRKMGMFKEVNNFTSRMEEYRNLSKRISTMSKFLREDAYPLVG